MTANTTDVYSGNLRPDDTDEIDFRRYILAIFRWWREIIVFSLLVGLLTGGTLLWLNNQKPPIYTASADILIERLLSNIELDERVSTSIGANQNDANGWRISLIQLSKSSVVANAVYEELKNELPEAMAAPELIGDYILAEIPLSPDERTASNLIRISAVTSNPELSAKLANAWARHLITFINGLYGEVPQTTIDSVTAERDSALAAYQAAELEYGQFIATNEIDSLSRQIQQKTALRDEIMANYARMLTAVVSSEYNTRVDIYTTLATTPINHARQVIATQSDGTVRTISMLYDDRAAVVAHLHQARSMQESLLAGGEAAALSNVTALQLLKVSALTVVQRARPNSTQLPATITLPEISMTLDAQLADVAALVEVLEDYVAQLDAEIVQMAETGIMGAEFESIAGIGTIIDPSDENAQNAANQMVTDAYAELIGPDGLFSLPPVDIDSSLSDAHEQVLTTLESEMRALRAEINAEEAQQRELSYRRDLAWTTYDTLGIKLEELNLLRSSANSEVRIGNSAMVPFAPVPAPSPLLPVVGVTLLAFFVAVIAALLADNFGVSPFFSRRTA